MGARVLGNQTDGSAARPSSGDPLHFFTRPIRTTPAQQTGLVPRLVEQVIPAHVPSHQLPPPAMIWSRFLSVYGVPAPDAAISNGGVLASDLDAGASKEDPDGPTIGGNGAGYLPPWLAGVDPSACFQSEFVDASWMDQLVQEALVQKS